MVLFLSQCCSSVDGGWRFVCEGRVVEVVGGAVSVLFT